MGCVIHYRGQRTFPDETTIKLINVIDGDSNSKYILRKLDNFSPGIHKKLRRMWIRVNSYNPKPEIHWSKMLKEITEEVSGIQKELAINLTVATMNVQHGASSRVEQYGKESHEVNTADIYITLNGKDPSAITIVNKTANIITKYFDQHEKVVFKQTFDSVIYDDEDLKRDSDVEDLTL